MTNQIEDGLCHELQVNKRKKIVQRLAICDDNVDGGILDEIFDSKNYTKNIHSTENNILQLYIVMLCVVGITHENYIQTSTHKLKKNTFHLLSCFEV